MTAQLPSRWKLKKIIETADQIIAEMAKSSSIDEWAFLNDDMGTPSEVKALAEFAMAAHEQEPVKWQDAVERFREYNIGFPVEKFKADYVISWVLANYPRTAPVPAVPECFERLLAHAQGIAMGVDWNKGTAATHHRDKLCQAVKDCAAMLNGDKS